MQITTPPMGFNTWNTYGPNISESMVLETAAAMKQNGLLDAGYKYIILDDGWSLKERDKSGHLVADPKKFPNGMKYLADTLHQMGFLFGIYSCCGYLTCGGYPGSYGHEWTDAADFAAWGVDYLKYDFCFRPDTEAPHTLYKRMGLALLNCGRKIVFAACSWGDEYTRQWVKETGADTWRSTGDIYDSWESVKFIATSQLSAPEYQSGTCFNDMDMLVVDMHGNGNAGLTGCTESEYKTHFAFWAMMSSPLIIGCDVRKISSEALALLKNANLIKICQNSAFQPFFINMEKGVVNSCRKPDGPCFKNIEGSAFYNNLPTEYPVIAKILNNGEIAVGVFNFSDEELNQFKLAAMPATMGITADNEYEFTDCFTGKKADLRCGVIFPESVAPHDCMVLIGKPVKR